ncbi:MAG: bifunctional heptose 7-phosphate kinase/heptose 1-phosphate adenyltransferase [Bacteroidales bacterium]
MQLARSVHPLPGDHERGQRLLDLIGRFGRSRVAVVGDLIADEFIYGQIARVSREAPVLILRYDSTQILPGGAGNAANNVAALGGCTNIVGLIGSDESGRRLRKSFHPGVSRHHLVSLRGYTTPTKTRILAGGIHSAKQQVVRIDRERPVPTGDPALAERIARAAEDAVAECDGVLVSDYGYGLVTPELVARLKARVARAGRRRPIPILVDSRYDLLRYKGLTACTPNEAEVEQILGVKINDHADVLERAGRALLKRSAMQAVLVTRGSRGMALFEPGRRTVHIPIYGSDEIADVTGAGDTVMATMVMALSAGASFYEASHLANYAGGLVVMKRGTATVSPEELRHAVETDHAAEPEPWSQEGPEQGRRS